MKEQVQQLALSCADLAREIAHGPSLFDARGMPTAAVERYTGGRVTRDPERCALAGAFKLLHWSDRQIAEVLGCDVRSIPLMVREAEKSGRIPAVKERLQTLVAHNAEESGIVLSQLLQKAAGGFETLELAAMLKSVGGVNDFQVKNHQLLTGAATEIIEVRKGAGQAERAAWALAHGIVVEVEASAVDAGSTENCRDCQQTATTQDHRPQCDTCQARDLADLAVGPPDSPARATPGGGGALPPGGAETKMVSSGSKF